MLYPDRATAEAELELGAKMNPGLWPDHSRNVGLACFYIAERAGLDPEKARALGTLHDIGRRAGVMQERHMIEGYRYCMERGWDAQARICITHSFPIRDITAALGSWDVTAEDYEFMKSFLAGLEYDDYDRLVQLGDSLAVAGGFCMIEQRLVDVALRYGVNGHAVPRWKETFAIKGYFERMMGASVYDVLPGVRESAFTADRSQARRDSSSRFSPDARGRTAPDPSSCR